MKIGVIGSGRMGHALGAALKRTGDDVQFGSRTSTRGVSYRDAAEQADVVVLATLWEETRAAIEWAGNLKGKLVLSCVNPSTETNPLTIGHSTSAAEEIARWAEGANVVEAFNATYAETVDLAPDLPAPQTVLYCGDDSDSRDTAGAIIRRLGFDPLDAGPLRIARYLEPLAQLVVHLVRNQGYGPLGLHPEWKRNGHGNSR